uniref:Peptidase_M1 domain-containing protein n=1 Tax=Macrostomum lignano TaxID=282301 RepID=A0A1I8FL93_9PLAT
WFGNIVTMTWWDDLWLNEAFANIHSIYRHRRRLQPDVRTWMDRCYVEFADERLPDGLNATLASDHHGRACPIPARSSPCSTTSAILRGSSLIRMLEGVIGRRVLKEGLMIYLNRYNYKWIIPVMYLTDKNPEAHGYFGSTDMAGLLNDAFTLAYIGRLNISVPFDLFETLEEDRLDSGTPLGQSSMHFHRTKLTSFIRSGHHRGNTSDWEFFWNKYNNDFVHILFDQGQIRQTDAITIAVKFARRSGAWIWLWTHFTRNWDQLLKIYGHMPFLMSDITKFPADYYTEFDYERNM